MIYNGLTGVPDFEECKIKKKEKDYVLLIPVINEGDRLKKELERGKEYSVSNYCDIVICDGGSNDGSTDLSVLNELNVNTLLIKKSFGRQGAQLRMGIWWALKRGYKGVLTIDGNNKDSIEDIPQFIAKLEEGFAYVQGSRFIEGGHAINTPFARLVAVRLLHAPIISLTARHRFTDTTNNFRGYSREYLEDKRVMPLREVFVSYELLAYLSVRASQIGYKVCEVPVTRKYPEGKIPTKIGVVKGNIELAIILVKNYLGVYNQKVDDEKTE